MSGYRKRPDRLSQREDPSSALEKDVDDAITICGGDLRAAVRALIVTLYYCEECVKRLHDDVSRGYSRGMHDGLFHPLLCWNPDGEPD
jgi:hypothetical protein